MKNAGANSSLTTLFWKMRYQRTKEAETEFLVFLERLHASKKTVFTSHLLGSTNSFLPSKIDPFLQRVDFVSLSQLKTLELSIFVTSTQEKRNALGVLHILKQQNPLSHDVFSYDNTNTIESYFNIIKGRIPSSSPRLVDIYNSISFTERSFLARHNPSLPNLPRCLVHCLLTVLSPDVLSVMSKEGVDAFIDTLIQTSVGILTETTGQCASTFEVERAVREGRQIEHFSWMPESWIVSKAFAESSHEILTVAERPEMPLHDVVGFLEPFLDLSTRSTEVFRLINDALMSLSDLKSPGTLINYPITFQFLKNEFDRYVQLARESAEITKILTELCESLKTIPTRETEKRNCVAARKSIVDPGFVRVMGPRSTSTSSKVDHQAVRPQTKMVAAFKESADSRRNGCVTSKRKNTCCVCLGLGHQARTCRGLVLPENHERTFAFLKKLVLNGKAQNFVAAAKKRMTTEDVEKVVDLLRIVEASNE